MELKKLVSLIRWFLEVAIVVGLSETTITNAPVQDEAVQGFNPPPSYLPHLISCSLHLQSLKEFMSLSSIEFRGNVDTRLEEGGEFNVEGIWRGKSKRSASSQMQKGKKITFSTFLFLLYDIFFFVVFFFLLFDKR